jgi:hypothetical protein
MAQTGFTPISLYYTATAAATPTAGNLVAGELAINTADGKLFYKDSAGVVQTIASKNSNSGIFPAGTVSAPSITFVGDTNTGIYSPAADTIAFTEGGVESMRITDVGNVGIGNNNPTIFSGLTTLSIGGSNRGLITVRNASNADRGYIYFDSTNFSVESVGAPLNLVSPTSQPILFTTAGAERMRIDSAGNVGIGTASAGQKLDVASGFIRTSTNDRGLIVGSGNQAYYSGGDSGVGTGYLTLNVGSERMRIDSSGNLNVGQSSGPNGGSRLGISNDCGVQAMQIWTNTAGGSTTQNIVLLYRGTTLTGSIQGTNTSTSYNTSSDYRLKENIAPMTGALEKVAQLKPVTYKWKVDGSDGEGFIAHELQAVIPDAVTGKKDGEQMQGIDTSFLVATLTAAIQELKAEFDAYKATHP